VNKSACLGRPFVASLVGLLTALSAVVAVAQPPFTGTDEIETDRDSFTPATTTVGRRQMMFESAYSFSDNPVGLETHSLPELVARYGVTDRIELRLGWNYEVGGASSGFSGGVPDLDEPVGTELEQGSQIFYGLKAAVTDQDNWLPGSAVVVEAGTPTSGKETTTQFITTYVFGWELPKEWKWDAALRYGYDSAEGDRFNIWAPSTVLKVPVLEQWTAHAEYFGIFSDGRAVDSTQHYFSPGVHYLVTPDLEVGVRLGWGLNDESANFFNNVGFGWRF